MKKLIILSFTLLFISCKSGLEKEFNALTKNEDLIEVSEQISPEEFNLLKTYIDQADYTSLTKRPYLILLDQAQEKERERIALEKRAEEERLAAEIFKIETAHKTALLCAHKWKIKEYAAVLEIDNIEDNIELAKIALIQSIMVKDSKMSISVENNYNKAIVKGAFDDKMLRIFNADGKRWIKYSPDGTYKEYNGGEIEEGKWAFTKVNEIFERRPSNTAFNNIESEGFRLEVLALDDKVFSFREKKQNLYSTNNNLSYEVVMR